MSFTHLFPTEAVLLGLDEADSDSVLGRLAGALAAQDPALAGREEEILAALQERESRGSTGSQGVGIPHVKLAGTSKVTAVIAVHPQGVDFRALDDEPVKVFFSVIRPEDGTEDHLDLLRWIASIAQHEDFVSFSCQASQPGQIVDLLSELAAV